MSRQRRGEGGGGEHEHDDVGDDVEVGDEVELAALFSGSGLAHVRGSSRMLACGSRCGAHRASRQPALPAARRGVSTSRFSSFIANASSSCCCFFEAELKEHVARSCRSRRSPGPARCCSWPPAMLGRQQVERSAAAAMATRGEGADQAGDGAEQADQGRDVGQRPRAPGCASSRSGVTSTSVSSMAVVIGGFALGQPGQTRPWPPRATGASRGGAQLDRAVDVVGGDQLADLLEERLGVHRPLPRKKMVSLDNDGDGDRRAHQIDVHEEPALVEELLDVLHVSSATTPPLSSHAGEIGGRAELWTDHRFWWVTIAERACLSGSGTTRFVEAGRAKSARQRCALGESETGQVKAAWCRSKRRCGRRFDGAEIEIDVAHAVLAHVNRRHLLLRHGTCSATVPLAAGRRAPPPPGCRRQSMPGCGASGARPARRSRPRPAHPRGRCAAARRGLRWAGRRKMRFSITDRPRIARALEGGAVETAAELAARPRRAPASTSAHRRRKPRGRRVAASSPRHDQAHQEDATTTAPGAVRAASIITTGTVLFLCDRLLLVGTTIFFAEAGARPRRGSCKCSFSCLARPRTPRSWSRREVARQVDQQLPGVFRPSARR